MWLMFIRPTQPYELHKTPWMGHEPHREHKALWNGRLREDELTFNQLGVLSPPWAIPYLVSYSIVLLGYFLPSKDHSTIEDDFTHLLGLRLRYTHASSCHWTYSCLKCPRSYLLRMIYQTDIAVKWWPVDNRYLYKNDITCYHVPMKKEVAKPMIIRFYKHHLKFLKKEKRRLKISYAEVVRFYLDGYIIKEEALTNDWIWKIAKKGLSLWAKKSYKEQ